MFRGKYKFVSNKGDVPYWPPARLGRAGKNSGPGPALEREGGGVSLWLFGGRVDDMLPEYRGRNIFYPMLGLYCSKYPPILIRFSSFTFSPFVQQLVRMVR